MNPACVMWQPGMAPLGRAVVAIGVFDGVHLGHQQLLDETATDASMTGVRSIALTFDRDPDQVVTPDNAAPQLLTMDDKCSFITECGVNLVLVVPFTEQVAAMPAETFLDEVLGSAVEVSAIHVGEDFRFGARAAGTVDTLRAWAAERGAEVVGHDLFEVDDAPVTSTRIRGLVSAGDVEAAAVLLGRPTRVSGVVHLGRQQGRALGFPTANVVPVPFAALPADGVYAGTAVLDDGYEYPAAISVGTPPSFPEARDYLEAHLVGFSGDLYDERITLTFVRRLRDQRSFDSMYALTTAIRADVEEVGRTVRTRAGFDVDSYASINDGPMEDGSPTIEDPAVLAAAEAAVAGMVRQRTTRAVDWVPVTDARHVSSLFTEAGMSAALVTSPLDAAGIPYAWDPYEPQDMPAFRYGYGAIDRRFTLYVPPERVDEARDLLGIGQPVGGAPTPFGEEEPGIWRYIGAAVVIFLLLAFLNGVSS